MQEMGDVGDEGDVVDEQLWGQDQDKPEQSKAEEKYEKDAPIQVKPCLPLDCHKDHVILVTIAGASARCVWLQSCLAKPAWHRNKAQCLSRICRQLSCNRVETRLEVLTWVRSRMLKVLCVLWHMMPSL